MKFLIIFAAHKYIFNTLKMAETVSKPDLIGFPTDEESRKFEKIDTSYSR